MIPNFNCVRMCHPAVTPNALTKSPSCVTHWMLVIPNPSSEVILDIQMGTVLILKIPQNTNVKIDPNFLVLFNCVQPNTGHEWLHMLLRYIHSWKLDRCGGREESQGLRG